MRPARPGTADVAVVPDQAGADDLVRRLRAAGFDAEASALPRPPDGPAPGPLGYRVRSGLFVTRAESDQRVAAIRAAGLPARGSVFTAEDGGRSSGPWVVHVLAIDPARQRLEAVLANDVVADRAGHFRPRRGPGGLLDE